MKMTGGRLLPVTPRQAWDALNDPAMLKDCIPGCESVTMTEPRHYELVMAAKIGPVSPPVVPAASVATAATS